MGRLMDGWMGRGLQVGFSGEAQRVETQLPIGGAETGRQRNVKPSLHSDVLCYCR